MFVRWIVRGHKNSEIANVTFHDAYLLESYRDENGNPRQRTITYLGNLREIDSEFPTIERELFLIRADCILETLAELSAEDRDDILNQLKQRVKPLNEEEVMIGFKNTIRWYYRWWQDNGRVPSVDDLVKQIKKASQEPDDLKL